MNKKVMKKWVKALLSGKYKQGRGLLKQTDHKDIIRHCCLGVLCELYNEDMKEKKKKKLTEKVDGFGVIRFNKQPEHLPSIVKDWADLNDNVGSIGAFDSLATINDDGKTFKTIAKIIEKNWENL
jgi:hypothetical protein